MSGASRFPPLVDADWPPELADLRDGFATRLNVYRVMAHRPDLLRAWAPLRDHVVRRTALGPELSEVAILRTGHRMESPYEWAHHVTRARALGMEDLRIATIGGPLDAMAPDDRTIAGAVDEIFDTHRLSPATVTAVTATVGADGIFDLIATVGFYVTLGGILNSFHVPLDDAVAGELSADPLPGGTP